MKKYSCFLYVFCVFLLSSAGRLESQEPGVKFGLVRSQASVSREVPGITWGSINVFSPGLYISRDIFGGQWGLQAEVNFPTKGFDARETDQGEEVSSKYKISYIELPVLIYWKLPLKGRVTPGLFLGPYFGIPQKAMEVQTAFGETEKRELRDNLKNLDVGIVLGVNVRYGLGSMVLMLDVRYSLGLSNISQNIEAVAYEFQEGDGIKNGALAVSLGVGFDLAKRWD